MISTAQYLREKQGRVVAPLQEDISCAFEYIYLIKARDEQTK